MAALDTSLFGNIPADVLIEIIRFVKVLLVILCEGAVFMLLKFKLHKTEKSKTVEKTTTIEIHGGFRR